jgi:UDP:flavonoid glycosyltransferase YjiC (YdhE family)
MRPHHRPRWTWHYYAVNVLWKPTPGHTEQISNAKQAEEIGVAKFILQNRLSREKLLSTVKEALGNRMVERAAEVQGEALKHDGLKNAVNSVIEVAAK